jgi:hypothetical protein
MIENLKNLNNAWVIVSRHNGNVFFKRRRYATKVKNYPDTECLWYSENEAKEELVRVNSGRKKCLHTIENASKYFVNEFSVNTWHGKHIKNIAVPIKSIQEKKVKITDVKTIKPRFLKDIEDNIKRSYDRIKSEQESITRLQLEFEQIKNTDIEALLAPFETQGDRIVKVLFSKVEKKDSSDEGVPF